MIAFLRTWIEARERFDNNEEVDARLKSMRDEAERARRMAEEQADRTLTLILMKLAQGGRP